MSAMWIIYLADIAQNISTFAAIVGGVSTCGAIILTCILTDLTTSERVKVLRYLSITIISAILFISAAIFIPTKQTIYMMAAAKVGQDIVEAPATKEISSKVLQLINQKLDEQLGGKK